jgi:hypothetical protein
MRAAHAISTVFRTSHPEDCVSIVGVPKTMGNDILWVWQSFGFMSAVEKAREVIIQLYTEVRSNPRLATSSCSARPRVMWSAMPRSAATSVMWRGRRAG